MYARLLEKQMSMLNQSLIPATPGAIFCDGRDYPEMVVIECSDMKRNATEGDKPIKIKRFALSCAPVRLKNWYVLFGFNSDRQTQIDTAEYGSILQMIPSDAFDFVERLRSYTAREYRFPTSSELEFALGTGSSQRYFWIDRFDNYESGYPEPMPSLTSIFVALDLPDSLSSKRGGASIGGFVSGEVDQDSEHIVLKYGDFSTTSSAEYIKVARIGKPVAGIVTVQFLIEPADDLRIEMLDEAFSQIKSYLVVTRALSPWEYAIHHCGTSANLYSMLHWGYCADKTAPESA